MAREDFRTGRCARFQLRYPRAHRMRWLDHREQLPGVARRDRRHPRWLPPWPPGGGGRGHCLGTRRAARSSPPSIRTRYAISSPMRRFRLTTLEQRQEHYPPRARTAMLVFHFDGEPAGTTAEDFVRNCWASIWAWPGWLPGRTSPSARRAVAISKGWSSSARTWGSRHALCRPSWTTAPRCPQAVCAKPCGGPAGSCAAAHPSLRDPRRGPARRQARARDRLSHRQPAGRALPAPQIRHLRGDRTHPSTGQELKGAPISACARISAQGSLNPISSTFRAISTARRSKSPSTTSCAVKPSSIASTPGRADGEDGDEARCLLG